MKHKNTRLFWFINLGVWIIYYLMQSFSSPLFLFIEPYNRLVMVIHFICYVMIITGCYRYIYQKFEFWKKSMIFTFTQAVIAALIMCVLDVLFRFYIHPIVINSEWFLTDWLKEKTLQSLSETHNPYMEVLKLSETNPNVGHQLRMESFNGQIMKFLAYVIWTFAFTAYRYSENLIEARVEKYRFEGQLKEAELVNLRSQLNPHFLFNSLNSIHSMTLMKREEASDAVLLLADLMRYTLNYEKKTLVTVEEEIEIVEKYLKLEKIRFGKKLNYSFDIQLDTLDKKIPPIVIQTLAENAIKHAISRSIEGGRVEIKSFLENDNLIIEVINSGQLAEAPPQYLGQKDANSEVKKSGIGIENTRRRLAMLYGDKAIFDLKNWGIAEVKAMMSIPT
jgi:sensor histidine kinase YesM